MVSNLNNINLNDFINQFMHDYLFSNQMFGF